MNAPFTLSDLGRTEPDGRPLHAYRLDEDAYDRLETLVRSDLRARRFASTAAPFVFWAAERYRREYDGGRLTWDFLARPLDIALTQQEFRDLTREGLARMKRSVRRAEGGTQYLRTIAAEGGIPVKLLSAENGGYRAALVGLVADLSRLGLGCPRDVAREFAAQRTRRLPLGYRTLEFHELFVDFAFEILELRELAPDGITAHQVEPFLAQVKPGWQDGLSLRLDGDAARSLLSAAVLVSARHGLVTDPLTRVLRRGEADVWTSWLEIEEVAEIASHLVEGVDRDRTRLRLGPVGALAIAAPDLLFALERQQADRSWDSRRISGRRTARFRFPLDTGAALMAMADGAFHGTVRLPGGGAVVPDAGPTFWRLAEMGETVAEALSYAGNASIRTRDPHIWVLTVPDRPPECTGSLLAVPDGTLLGGTLWRLSGEGRVLVRGGNAEVRTAAEEDARDEIHVCGPLHPRILDGQGGSVHRGVPAVLYRQAGRGWRELTGAQLRHRVGGSHAWRPGAPPAETLGRVEFALRAQDGVGARVAATMLPEALSVRDVTSAADARRRLRFEGVPEGWIVRVGDGAPERARPDGPIELLLDDVTARSGRLPLVIASPDGARPVSWLLDLPRARGEFRATQGEGLSRDRDISMQELRDWSILPAEDRRTDLQIRLHSPSVAVAAIVGKRVATELPLSAFRPLLEEMLTVGGADAELRLRVVTDGDQSPRLCLRHGLGHTGLRGEDVAVLQGQDAVHDPSLEITAIDLDDPSRVVQTGPRALSHLGDGRWFLLPHRRGVPMRPPRPLVQPVPAEPVGADAPRRADRVAHFVDRFRGADGTAELSRLAVLVELLLEHGTSPSALDQVQALADVPTAAVRLLLRVGPSALEDALSLELHGGPTWAFVGPEVWGEAMAEEGRILRSELMGMPSLAAKADDYVRDMLTGRAADILRLRPTLKGHVCLGLIRIDPLCVPGLARRLGGLPPALQRPEAALLDAARAVVARQSDQLPPFHELAARHRPAGFAMFDQTLRGLIEAPLVVAEIAFGLRPPPTTRQRIELLQAMQADQATYETALPAAIAWTEHRITGEAAP